MRKIQTWANQGISEIDLFQSLTERFVTDVILHYDTRLLEIKLRSDVLMLDEYIIFSSINHLIKTMSMVNSSDEVIKRIQTIVSNCEEYNIVVDIKKLNQKLKTVKQDNLQKYLKIYDVLKPINASKLH